MKNGNMGISNSDLSSHLELNILKHEEYLPMKCPYNYQFYFDNIQIVGKENFKDDYMKIYKKNRKEIQSLNYSPPTPQTNSDSSPHKSSISNNNGKFENNYIKELKNNKSNKGSLIINNNKDNVESNYVNNDIAFQNNELINNNQQNKNRKKNNLNEEKLQSSCCEIF